MAKRTSFQDADRSNKTLREMIQEQEGGEAHEESQEAASQAEETQQEPAEDTTPDKGTSQGSEPGDQEVKEERTPSPFASYLRGQGYDVDEEVEDEDLYKSVAERIKAQEQLQKQIELERQEREKIQKELEDLRQAAQSQPQQEATQQATAEVVAEESKRRGWEPIEEPDRDLLKFVERDPSTGMFRSRDEYQGQGGEDAARKFNEYQAEVQKRSRQLLANPVDALLQGGLEDRLAKVIEERAEKLLEEKMKGFGDFKGEALAEFERKREQEERERRIESFYNERAGDFFKTNVSGQMVRDFNGEPILTELGRAFQEESRYLRQAGIQDEETLLNTAWRNVSRLHPRGETPAEEPVATGKEKRRRFVERRESVSPEPPANRDGYSKSGQTPGRNRPPSLAELVQEDPEASQL